LIRGLYTFGIKLYGLAISFASLFQEKASKWKKGRKNLFEDLPENLHGCIWIHCASLGEFEQGRPIIEELKEKSSRPIFLTFFSPSGYEIRKNYPLADAVSYLPLDTPKNAKRFLSKVRPEVAIFIKYEIWHNFFREAFKREIPVYLVSAIFRLDQVYFKSYGGWFLDTLKGLSHIFCQDLESVGLLKSRGLNNVSVSGDTRFDRVKKLADSAEPIPEINDWLKGRRAVIIGSSWYQDEKLVASILPELPQGVAVIIAPHEISPPKIKRLKSLIPEADVYSEKRSLADPSQVLILDTIGLLSRLYRMGEFAYIGGGFGVGIHNTLEAAVYGIPVIFGPHYKKFREAIGLRNAGAGFAIEEEGEFHDIFFRLLEEDEFRLKAGEKAKAYIESESGATDVILNKTGLFNLS